MGGTLGEDVDLHGWVLLNVGILELRDELGTEGVRTFDVDFRVGSYGGTD